MILLKIIELIENGATIIFADRPEISPGLHPYEKQSEHFHSILEDMLSGDFKNIETSEGSYDLKTIGKGRIIKAPFMAKSFSGIGIDKDLSATENGNSPATDIAWNHRCSPDFDIYFISNQRETPREINISVRADGYIPEIFDPLDGKTFKALNWCRKDGRTYIPLRLEANASLFLVFSEKTNLMSGKKGENVVDLANKILKKYKSFYSNKTLAFVMTTGSSTDIDEEIDIQIAEQLMKQR